MSRILVVGLNPAWQKVLRFGEFRPGGVNRARESVSLASGKGINAARVLRRLGHEVWVLQILGGANGRRCLEACEALGIHSLPVWVGAETRQCITLLQAGDAADPSGERARMPEAPLWEATEIIEPFRVEDPGAGPALLEALPGEAGAFDGLALCGSVPPGAGEGLYDAIMARFRPRASVIDAWQDLRPETLARATCVKMNRSEYASLEERLGPGGAGEALFLLTSGAGEASVLRAGKTLARLAPPRLERAVNPIGAGDTVTAAVLHNLLEGLDAVEAFRRGLALGTASCLDPLPAGYSESDYQRLLAGAGILP